MTESEFNVLQVLVREKKWTGRGQTPMSAFITDHFLFFGGSDITSAGFEKIPYQDITSVKEITKPFFRSIEICYNTPEGEKKTYVCPFTGPPDSPKVDEEMLSYLKDECTKKAGTEIELDL